MGGGAAIHTAVAWPGTASPSQEITGIPTDSGAHAHSVQFPGAQGGQGLC